MNVLTIDIGGTNIKILRHGTEGAAQVSLGSDPVARQMVDEVKKLAADGVFLTKTAKSQFVSKKSDFSPLPRCPYRGPPLRFTNSWRSTYA